MSSVPIKQTEAYDYGTMQTKYKIKYLDEA